MRAQGRTEETAIDEWTDGTILNLFDELDWVDRLLAFDRACCRASMRLASLKQYMEEELAERQQP